MAKKQPPEERRPDLAAPDQDEIEKRVKEMLELEETPEEPKSSSIESDKPTTKIEISHFEETTTAPELPSDDKKDSKTKETKETDESSEPEPATEDEPEEPEPQPEKVVNLDEAPTDKAIIQDLEADTKDDLSEETDKDDTDESSEPEPATEDEPEEPEKEVKKTPLDEVINDTKTSKAVDDILAKESDALLDLQDQKEGKTKAVNKTSLGEKVKGFFKAWWSNPKARWITIIVLVLAVATVAALPTTRYFTLNTLGFRANAKVVVLDESTGQPLKNVLVKIASSEAKTDTSGVAELSKVKLGSTKLVVQKRAFAEIQQPTTIKFGHNDFKDVRLKPTGVQYSFVVTDFLSGKPIQKAEAVSGEASAISDENGKIKLTVEGDDEKDILDVSFQKEDYRKDTVKISADVKTEQPILMVAGRRHVFVSKRSGVYDVYAIDVDGKNEKKVLAGTGSERDDIALSIHPTASVVALVSTREGKKNNDGFLLSSLTMVDEQSGKSKSVVSSERLQLIDWIDDDLIYVQAVSGASAGNPKRHRLMSYNYKTEQSRELAASNYFNDVIVFDNKVFVAPSSAYATSPTVLTRMAPDGNSKVTILNQEIWNIFRTDYENLALSANQTWFNVRAGEDKATTLNTQPTNPNSRIYVTSKDKKHSLWVDQRDGKGVLLNYEISTRNEQTLRSENGIKTPVYWLNNRTIVYRVSNESEIADYVVSLDGGESKKITDVTNTNSVEQWYYYQ